MHVYDEKLDDMWAYVEEAVQQTIEMPPMPCGNTKMTTALQDRLIRNDIRAKTLAGSSQRNSGEVVGQSAGAIARGPGLQGRSTPSLDYEPGAELMHRYRR